ncbi:MAG: GNAT family N-acyltransferase [Pseudomonadota bacterium]
MDRFDPHLSLRLAETGADRRGAYRTRYEVFVDELGAAGDLVDHDNRLEMDRYDPYFDQLILVDDRVDPDTGDHVAGVYRLMRQDQATQAGQFYSEDEYDLSVLRRSGRRLLELGRSCVRPAHRNGAAMLSLWDGLAAYVRDHAIDVLFGVASFHGTDVSQNAEPLSLLHHRHLAPPNLRVRAREFQRMDLIHPDAIDRPAAMRRVPALIKSYLKLGGSVGEGAFIDHAFNTIDVCLVMDTAAMTAAARNRYGAPA